MSLDIYAVFLEKSTQSHAPFIDGIFALARLEHNLSVLCTNIMLVLLDCVIDRLFD
jgi:hypothetical protein